MTARENVHYKLEVPKLFLVHDVFSVLVIFSQHPWTRSFFYYVTVSVMLPNSSFYEEVRSEQLKSSISLGIPQMTLCYS